MRYLRNDYPRRLLEELNEIYDDMPPVPPAHVYIVTTKDFTDKKYPVFTIHATYHSLIVAHQQATHLFKTKYLMWFMQSLNFENWLQKDRNGDTEGFEHVVMWEIYEQGGLDLEAWWRSAENPNQLEFLGSIEVEYHLINGI